MIFLRERHLLWHYRRHHRQPGEKLKIHQFIIQSYISSFRTRNMKLLQINRKSLGPISNSGFSKWPVPKSVYWYCCPLQLPFPNLHVNNLVFYKAVHTYPIITHKNSNIVNAPAVLKAKTYVETWNSRHLYNCTILTFTSFCLTNRNIFYDVTEIHKKVHIITQSAKYSTFLSEKVTQPGMNLRKWWPRLAKKFHLCW